MAREEAAHTMGGTRPGRPEAWFILAPELGETEGDAILQSQGRVPYPQVPGPGSDSASLLQAQPHLMELVSSLNTPILLSCCFRRVELPS